MTDLFPIGTVITAAVNTDRRFKNDKPGRRHVVVGHTNDNRLVTLTFTAGAAEFFDITPTRQNGFTKPVELITDVKIYVDPTVANRVGVLPLDETKQLVKTWKNDTRRVWIGYAG